jgi:Family of unknown function (DUF6064)
MALPFTRDAFLDVFAAYNTSWWLIAFAFWILTLTAFVSVARGHDESRWTFGLLAVQWGWSAVAYHAILFSRINPVAWAFAAIFLVQAGLLVWYGAADDRLRFGQGRAIARHPALGMIAYGLIAYGLLYPFIVLAGGHVYPRLPTFGVPCPTTIVTIGFMLLVDERLPVALVVVPLLWSVIGGSAAFTLGMHADLALIVSGCALLWRETSEAIGSARTAAR